MVEVARNMSTSPISEDTNEVLRNEYVQDLREAVKFFLLQGRVPTASQVRSRLGHITAGRFDPKQIGFSRFRDFLDFAEAAESITVDHARVGDVTVSLPGIEHASSASSSRAIRKDLWGAFLGWENKDVRYYDRIDDCIRNVPNEIAPLESEELAQIRNALQENPDQYVAVTPVDRDTQISWMQRFAQDVPDREVKNALLIALASVNAAGEFITVLKNYPTELRRWYSYLATHVDKSITDWMAANNLQIDPWVENSGRVGPPTESTARVSAEGRLLGGEKTARGTHRFDADARIQIPSVEDLRSILHAAIDRMSVEQLQQLPIPVGHLFNL